MIDLADLHDFGLTCTCVTRDGQARAVTAGWAMFDWDGNLLAFTPNQGTSLSMICEYLGGNPA